MRFGELNPEERRRLELFDARLERLFDAASAAERDARWWREAMQGVHPDLEAEKRAEGVVVRSEHRELFPLAERAVRRSPAALGLVLRRPACALDRALERARAACGVDFAAAGVRAGFGRGHLLELVLHVPGASGSAGERDAARDLVSDLLGEQRAEDWVGRVAVAPAPRSGPLRVIAARPEEPRLDLAELEPAVSAAIAGVRAELPGEPWCASGAGREWTLFELEPEPGAELDAAPQGDLVMTTTCVPELLKSYLEAAPFSSLRFSRHGELFAHLRYRAGGDAKRELARRTALEDELDALLSAARAGRVVGGGLGLRFSYVDLALFDVEPALSLARECARGAGLPSESWIQPFDSDLRAEWVEVWPGAPPPPLALD